MIRTILTVVTVAALLSACSRESPHASQAVDAVPHRGTSALVPVQLTQRPEITVEKILTDIVGKEVATQDAAGEAQPMDWVFEADEPKNAEILERKTDDKGMALLIQMSTGGAPGSDDANVQLSGRLMLHYEWNGRDWILRRIQNMTFRYTRRFMI